MSSNLLKAIMLCDNNSEEAAYYRAHQQEEEELLEIYREAYGSTSGTHGSSIMGRKYINRNQAAYYKTFMQGYFSRNLTYGEEMFRQRFRMSRELLLRILENIR